MKKRTIFFKIIVTVLWFFLYSNNSFVFSKSKCRQFPVDTLADETSKFLVGMPTKIFSEKQKSPKYSVHKNLMESGFKNFTKPTVKKISAWISDKKSIQDTSSHCLFYPFSGPDFLYADAFFPNKEKYILFGLEKIGKLPDLKIFPDSLLYGYLENLRLAMQYINKNGYFVTRQMNDFFSDQNLDGVVHLLFCYLTETSHTISKTRNIVLDFDGNISTDYGFSDQAKFTKGIEIQFFKTGEPKLKTLYYTPLRSEE